MSNNLVHCLHCGWTGSTSELLPIDIPCPDDTDDGIEATACPRCHSVSDVQVYEDEEVFF